MSLTTPIDPRAIFPLAYFSGRLGYRVSGYRVDGPGKDVLSADLARGDTLVHVDWFPRTQHVLLSRGTELLGAYGSFAELAEALETLAD
jgi:hypothetical protein